METKNTKTTEKMEEDSLKVMKHLSEDLPSDKSLDLDVKKMIEDCIYDVEADFITDHSLQSMLPNLDSLYRCMEYYYKIKLLKKTLDDQVFMPVNKALHDEIFNKK